MNTRLSANFLTKTRRSYDRRINPPCDHRLTSIRRRDTGDCARLAGPRGRRAARRGAAQTARYCLAGDGGIEHQRWLRHDWTLLRRNGDRARVDSDGCFRLSRRACAAVGPRRRAPAVTFDNCHDGTDLRAAAKYDGRHLVCAPANPCMPQDGNRFRPAGHAVGFRRQRFRAADAGGRSRHFYCWQFDRDELCQLSVSFEPRRAAVAGRARLDASCFVSFDLADAGGCRERRDTKNREFRCADHRDIHSGADGDVFCRW